MNEQLIPIVLALLTEPIQVALIVALPPTVVSLTSLAVSLFNRKNLSALHVQVNSRMDEMVKLVGESQRAQGKLEGVAEQRILEGEAAIRIQLAQAAPAPAPDIRQRQEEDSSKLARIEEKAIRIDETTSEIKRNIKP